MASNSASACNKLLVLLVLINQLGMICTCRPIITINHNVQMESEALESNYDENELTMGGNDDGRMERSEVYSGGGLMKNDDDGGDRRRRVDEGNYYNIGEQMKLGKYDDDDDDDGRKASEEIRAGKRDDGLGRRAQLQEEEEEEEEVDDADDDEGGGAGVPSALLVFGDSTVDAGTNKYLLTISRSDFSPYGRDLPSHLRPTGRFSNGLLVTDYLASMMGLHTHTVAYLDIKQRINQGIGLLEKPIEMEVSFASASSGIFDSTALHFNALPLSKQLDHFKEYKYMLMENFGKPKSLEILKRAIFILSTGTNDFLNNYMLNPYLRAKYTLEEFQALILGLCAQFIQDLYNLGARRIGVVSLPPFGCLPAMMTLYMHTNIGCVEHLNEQATKFNRRLKDTMDVLERDLNGLRLAYMDSYNVLFNVIHNPKEYGLKHTQRACCGSGKLEAGPFCNQLIVGTCEDATDFAFWDSFHSTDHMNQILALELFDKLWVELEIKQPYAYYCKRTIMNVVNLKERS